MSKAATVVVALAISLIGIGTLGSLASATEHPNTVIAVSPQDCTADMHWTPCP